MGKGKATTVEVGVPSGGSDGGDGDGASLHCWDFTLDAEMFGK